MLLESEHGNGGNLQNPSAMMTKIGEGAEKRSSSQPLTTIMNAKEGKALTIIRHFKTDMSCNSLCSEPR
jgi:hypothetical protein